MDTAGDVLCVEAIRAKRCTGAPRNLFGHENYPWSRRIRMERLRTNADFERILEDMKKGFRKIRRLEAAAGTGPPDGE